MTGIMGPYCHFQMKLLSNIFKDWKTASLKLKKKLNSTQLT